MSYNYMTPADTPDVTAARAAANENSQSDPSIQYRAANQIQASNNSLNNPFGANVAPETLEAMKYARNNQIGQQEGQEMQTDAYNRKQAKFQNLYALAGLTSPKLVQTGGSATGSQTTPFNWGGFAAGGLSAALGA